MTSGDFDIIKCLQDVVADQKDMSMPVAAVKALTEFIKQSKASTMSELTQNLKHVSSQLKTVPRNAIAVSAGCDLFLQFVTRTGHDFGDFEACKAHIIQRGQHFVQISSRIRDQVAEVGLPFIKDDATILLHSYSKVVMLLLRKAQMQNKRFKVYVTESRPSNAGNRAVEELKTHGIPAKVILDAAVGFIIEKVDMVLVGAEGVVENGGIINQIGTYQLSVVANAAHKPFYCVTETYKFVRLFPLNQYDLPGGDIEENWDDESFGPHVDYTPPNFITLLFTERGVMTPSSLRNDL